MKRMMLAVGMILAFGANAGMNKCIVDGKTLYQRAPCPTDESQRTISNKTFTNGMSHNELRHIMVADEKKRLEIEKMEVAYAKAERARELENIAIEQRDVMNKRLKRINTNIILTNATVGQMKADNKHDRFMDRLNKRRFGFY